MDSYRATLPTASCVGAHEFSLFHSACLPASLPIKAVMFQRRPNIAWLSGSLITSGTSWPTAVFAVGFL
jgi:hypothetical protein